MVAPSKPAVMLVDGYNVIGAHPVFQALRDSGGLEEARRALTELLTNYSAYHAYEVTIVFDAHYQEQPGREWEITQNLSVVYTQANQTADSYIERACARFFRHDLRRFSKRMIVATSDRAQWLTTVGYGAEWMSSPQLLREAEACEQKVRKKRSKPKQSKKRFLASGLDADVQSKLARMRQDLLNQGS